MAITDLLNTTRSKDDLRVALEILREFKQNESADEYLSIMFSAWVKLEQLEEFLEHLVENKPLKADTIAYIRAGQ
jgi:predicted transcriptional regulator